MRDLSPVCARGPRAWSNRSNSARVTTVRQPAAGLAGVAAAEAAGREQRPSTVMTTAFGPSSLAGLVDGVFAEGVVFWAPGVAGFAGVVGVVPGVVCAKAA